MLKRFPLCGVGLACAALLPVHVLGDDFVLTMLGSGRAADVNSSGQVLVSQGGITLYGSDLANPVSISGPPVNIDGLPETIPVALNDAVHVAGYVRYGAWAQGIMFVNTGSTIETQSVSGQRNVVWGLNNSDLVVGHQESSSNGQFTAVVGTLPNATPVANTGFSIAFAVNDAGVAVGTASDSANPAAPFQSLPARACRFVGGAVEYIDTRPPGDEWVMNQFDETTRLSEARSINLQGDIVGLFRSKSGAPAHAFRHTGQGLEDLGTLGGPNSRAWDINSRGQIVGEAETADGKLHAFLWENGTLLDLNSVVPAVPGRTLIRAKAINDAGRIVGDAGDPNNPQVFVLDPPTGGIPAQISALSPDATIPLGTSLTLSATVRGTPPLSLQWEKNEVPIAGETSSSLLLSAVTGLDSGDYRLVATNAFGRAISLPARVTVVDPKLTPYTLTGLTIEGVSGVNYRVDFAPSLATNDWKPLATVTLTNSPQWFVDFESATNAARVYRAVRLP